MSLTSLEKGGPGGVAHPHMQIISRAEGLLEGISHETCTSRVLAG